MEKDIKKEKKNTVAKSKKAMKNGSYSAILTLVVIAVIVVINLIVGAMSAKHTMFDVSSQKLYTIGDETKSVLKNLDKDVQIYYMTSNDDEDPTITMMLENYMAESKHIKVEKKDPEVFPGFVSQYSDESLSVNSLIVVCGERVKCLDYSSDIYVSTINSTTYEATNTEYDGEGQVTSAINYVTSDEDLKVYNITGHSEAEIDDDLMKQYDKLNITIEDLALLTADAIPEDAAAIIISSPTTDYSEDDVKKVEDYLNAGGDALVIANYSDDKMERFTKMLADYNIELLDGVIFEGDANHYINQNPMYLVPTLSTTSTLTNSISNGYVFFPIAQGMRQLDNDDAITVESILTTTNEAYVKTNVQGMESYAMEDGDIAGPFIVGATVYKTVKDGSYDDQMRMAVFTSASFAMGSADDMVSGSNFKLLDNSMSWLINISEDSTIESKNIELDYLTVTSSKVLRWTVILVAVIPALCLILGGGIWFLRRRK